MTSLLDDTPMSAGSLTVQGIALRHAEGKHRKDMGRKVRELFHKGAHLILFTGIGNVGDVDEKAQSLSLLFMETADVEDLAPFFVGQGKPRRLLAGVLRIISKES